MKEILMSRGARTLVEVCGNVQPGEQVLIISEPEMSRIASTLASAVYAAKAEPTIEIMPPRKSDGQEPPPPVAAAMRACDIFYSAVKVSITHSQAVIDAVKSGSRGLVMSQWTEDMMISGGIEADFKAVAPICKAVAEAMAGAKQVRLTTPFGTDLVMSTEGRRANVMTCMVSKGQFSGVPNVEANTAPIEGSAEGVIVTDASIPYAGIGLLREPVICKVEKGLIVSIEGGRQARDLEEILRSKNDPNVYNIAEIGVGLNPKSVFSGIMMEDEGVWGSVHIGIGTNATVGGKVRAAIHYDLIVTKATLTADGQTVLKDGEVCVK